MASSSSSTPVCVDLCSSSASGSSSEDEVSDTDHDDAGELNPGPSKKAKKQLGAGSYKTKFNKEWTKEYPFIQASTNSIYKFYCTMCSRDVSCGHMGRADVERHIGKTMHKMNVKALHRQRTLNFAPASSPINDKVRSMTCNLVVFYSYKIIASMVAFQNESVIT